VVFLAAAAESSWIDQYAQESAAAAKACGARQYDGCRAHLTRLHELLDGRADIVYRLAKVEAASGNNSTALDWLTIFSKSGLTFANLTADPDFAAVRDNQAFRAAVARLDAARQPVTSSKPLVKLPEPDLVAEDIAYDAATRRFFVSSVRHGKIVAIDVKGQAGKGHAGKGHAATDHAATDHAADFVPEGQRDIWAILALRADSKRRALWATTVAMPEALAFTAAADGRSALLEYDLDSGKLLHRYDVQEPGKHALGDMTIGPAGDVYVSDGSGAVYHLDQARRGLELLVAPGTFRSPQTPALAPDGSRLFVPDYSRGIGILDLKTKSVKLLEHPPELSLAGIDGLYLAGASLIAIQNGTAPPRVIRISLDAGLTRAVNWQTMEANWPGLGQPTHGVLVGRDFHFIANSGWDQLGDDGKLKPGAEFSAAEIRVMRLPD
jgi:sugar lactone lactonase YvrE